MYQFFKKLFSIMAIAIKMVLLLSVASLALGITSKRDYGSSNPDNENYHRPPNKDASWKEKYLVCELRYERLKNKCETKHPTDWEHPTSEPDGGYPRPPPNRPGGSGGGDYDRPNTRPTTRRPTSRPSYPEDNDRTTTRRPLYPEDNDRTTTRRPSYPGDYDHTTTRRPSQTTKRPSYPGDYDTTTKRPTTKRPSYPGDYDYTTTRRPKSTTIPASPSRPGGGDYDSNGNGLYRPTNRPVSGYPDSRNAIRQIRPGITSSG